MSIMCSNVYHDVTSFEVSGFTKTQNSEYPEKKHSFFK